MVDNIRINGYLEDLKANIIRVMKDAQLLALKENLLKEKRAGMNAGEAVELSEEEVAGLAQQVQEPDPHYVLDQVRAQVKGEFLSEQPMMTEKQATKAIRKLYPGYEPPVSGSYQTQLDKRMRAVDAYVDGQLSMISPVDHMDVFSRDRASQRLSRFMRNDQERQEFADAYRQTSPEWYADKKMKPEQVSAAMQQAKAKVDQIWMDNITRLLEEQEAVINQHYSDDDLIEKYPNMAVAISLTQEAVKSMGEHAKDAVKYPPEKREEYRQRLTKMMGYCVEHDKRVCQMADTYAPVINLDSIAKAPYHMLQKLNNELTTEYLKEFTDVGEEDEDEFEKGLKNTVRVPNDAVMTVAPEAGLGIAAHFGCPTEQALYDTYYFFNNKGELLDLKKDPLTELSRGDVIHAMRRDGIGKMESIYAPTGNELTKLVYGMENIKALELKPVPPKPSFGIFSRFGNWVYESVTGRQTRAKKEYDRLTVLRNEVLEQNRMLEFARSEAGNEAVRSAETVVKNYAKQTDEAEHVTENIIDAMAGVPMKEGETATYKSVAALMVTEMLRQPMGKAGYIDSRKLTDPGAPGFDLLKYSSDLSKDPAFQELVDKDILGEDVFAQALRSGDGERIRDMTKTIFDRAFLPYCRNDKNKQKPSAEKLAQIEQAKKENLEYISVQPGHLESQSDHDRMKHYMGNEKCRQSILDMYGAHRNMRRDWMWINNRGVYTMDGWKEMEKNEIDLSRLTPHDKAVDDLTFASLSMTISLQRSLLDSLNDKVGKKLPDSVTFEDMVQINQEYEPRDGMDRVIQNAIDPCRRTVESCLTHFEEALPGEEPAITGREKLAKVLAESLQEFDRRSRNYEWRIRSHSAVTEIAGRALDFARELGLTDLMKQNGLTEEHLKNIQISRQLAKIQLDQADAERKLIQDSNWEIEMTPEQRLDCVNKMTLGLTMQAEIQRSHKATKEVTPPPAPKQEENETEEAFYRRRAEWMQKVTQMVDDSLSNREYSDAIADVCSGGSQLQKLSEKLLSPDQRESLAKRGPEAAYEELKQDLPKIAEWEKKVKAVYENEGRERMEEKQRRIFAEKIDGMRKDPAHAGFVAAVDDVLKNGSDAAKHLLYHMDDPHFTELQEKMAKSKDAKLGEMLEKAVSANEQKSGTAVKTENKTAEKGTVGMGKK